MGLCNELAVLKAGNMDEPPKWWAIAPPKVPRTPKNTHNNIIIVTMPPRHPMENMFAGLFMAMVFPILSKVPSKLLNPAAPLIECTKSKKIAEDRDEDGGVRKSKAPSTARKGRPKEV